MRSEFRMITAGIIRHLSSTRPYVGTHFSQEGEDLILARIFAGQSRGFYVDVGAHHPFRFSNTFWAYQLGWRGINIDPSRRAIAQLRRFRRSDINVLAAVSRLEVPLDMYQFPETALNTTDLTRAEKLAAETGMRFTCATVESLPLGTLLQRMMPSDIEVIDFMSIDVEGKEMDVLESNNWDAFKPRVVVVEVIGATLSNIGQSDAVCFLEHHGFTPVAMLYHSVILISDGELLARHWGGA